MAQLLRHISLDFDQSRVAVLMVGHEPDLGMLASRLLYGRSGVAISLRKGGFCRLDVAPGCLRNGACAVLRWLVTPRILLRGRI